MAPRTMPDHRAETLSVELIGPASLTTGGERYYRNVPKAIAHEDVDTFVNDERFIVHGLGGAQALNMRALAKRPRDRATLLATIGTAIESLDSDDPFLFATVPGAGEEPPRKVPNHYALSQALGFEIDEDDVQAALDYDPTDAQQRAEATAADLLPHRGDITSGEIRNGTNNPGKKRLRIVRGAAKKAQPPLNAQGKRSGFLRGPAAAESAQKKSAIAKGLMSQPDYALSGQDREAGEQQAVIETADEVGETV